MSDHVLLQHRSARHGRIWASVVSATCLLRSLPLFFRATPRTPLRVLGIVALDTLHVLRYSQLLPRQRVSELALFMDFQGCANATWDHKVRCEDESQVLRHRLDQAGLGPCIEEYLGRLQHLESRRPPIGGDHQRFDEVRSYREGVVRLAISTAAAIALNDHCRKEDIRAAHCDSDVDTLFRILMQCQIIDDVLDYAEDRSAGLPSFLTASASLPQAMRWTAEASRDYAAAREPSSVNDVFPIRVALTIAAAAAQFIVRCRTTPRE